MKKNLIKNLALLLLTIITITSCSTETQHNVADIRPMAKLFLIYLSQENIDQCHKRVTSSYMAREGWGTHLREIAKRYKSFLTPRLFEFDAPIGSDDNFVVRAYLHDGKGNILTIDLFFIWTDPYWRIDEIRWYDQGSSTAYST
jgi:hypothetical protein